MDCALKFVSRNLVTQKGSSNSETNGNFFDFLGDKLLVTSRTRFFSIFGAETDPNEAILTIYPK